MIQPLVGQVENLSYVVAFLTSSPSSTASQRTSSNPATFTRHDSADSLDSVIQPLIVEQMKERLDRPRFGVGGPVDHDRDAGLEDSSGAHGAGL